jgi:opacity protein-like surface antigen
MMIKKIYIAFVLAFLSISTVSMSQSFRYAGRIGAGITDIDMQMDKTPGIDINKHINVGGAFSVDYRFSKLLSVQAEVNYMRYSVGVPFNYDNTDNQISLHGALNFSMPVFSFPVMLKCHAYKGFSFYGGGVLFARGMTHAEFDDEGASSVSNLLRSTDFTPNGIEILIENATDENFHSCSIGYIVGAEYVISKRFLVDFRYVKSCNFAKEIRFDDIKKKISAATGREVELDPISPRCKISSLELSFGYIF